METDVETETEYKRFRNQFMYYKILLFLGPISGNVLKDTMYQHYWL